MDEPIKSVSQLSDVEPILHDTHRVSTTNTTTKGQSVRRWRHYPKAVYEWAQSNEYENVQNILLGRGGDIDEVKQVACALAAISAIVVMMTFYLLVL